MDCWPTWQFHVFFEQIYFTNGFEGLRKCWAWSQHLHVVNKKRQGKMAKACMIVRETIRLCTFISL